MAKTINLSDTEQVTQLIQKLESPSAEIVESVRKIILSIDKEIGEQIKWNSPSFYFTGEMKPFNPKEYKRDIVVLNLHRGEVLLVFPTGASVKDDSGFLQGDYKDGRRMAKFPDMKSVEANAGNLQDVIRKWLDQVEK